MPTRFYVELWHSWQKNQALNIINNTKLGHIYKLNMHLHTVLVGCR